MAPPNLPLRAFIREQRALGSSTQQIAAAADVSVQRIRELTAALGLVSDREIAQQRRAYRVQAKRAAIVQRAVRRRAASADRFLPHGRSAEECWPWPGKRNSVTGYGMAYDPTVKRSVLAHRIAWRRVYGAIPEGLHVCHHCDNPPCVNPHHLFLGTAQDNIHDSMRKGRWLTERRRLATERKIAERKGGTNQRNTL